MFVARVKRTHKGKTYESILVRESYRDASGRVRQRTLASLTKLPSHVVRAVELALAGGTDDAAQTGTDLGEIKRSLPHGHVAAVLGTMRKLALPELLGRRPSRQRQLALALVAGQLLWSTPGLDLYRRLRAETACSTLAEELQIHSVEPTDLDAAADWLLGRQNHVQRALLRRYLNGDTLLLYDVSSAPLAPNFGPLFQETPAAETKGDTRRPVAWLVCTTDGCPIAIRVFAGTTDTDACLSRLKRLRKQLGVDRVVLVDDRIEVARRIRSRLRGMDGFAWITTLPRHAAERIARTEQLGGAIGTREPVEIKSPEYPGERLILYRDPLLATAQAEEREALLAATEGALRRLAQAMHSTREPLLQNVKIREELDEILAESPVANHFRYKLTQGSFRFWRDADSIARAAAFDGICVIHTNVPATEWHPVDVVRAYRALSTVKGLFRFTGTGLDELQAMPDRNLIRAHAFICMLAYHVRWHMEQALAPLFFGGNHHRGQTVADQAGNQADSCARAATPMGESSACASLGVPEHSFETILDDLATLCRHELRARGAGSESLVVTTRPTPFQQRVFELLGLGEEVGHT